MLHNSATLIALLALPLANALPKLLDIDIDLSTETCTTLFYDDFSDRPAGSLPSSDRWTFDLGTSYPGGPANWGNGEAEYYTADTDNVHITEDGTLKITPILGANGNWTSSRIETTKDWDFGCKAGQRVRVEARIKTGANPKDKSMGIWPAFWSLGSDFRGNYTNWPAIGEIDIMETLNGETKVWQTVHCGTIPGGPCDEYNGIGNSTENVARGEWHTFAWEVNRQVSHDNDDEEEESMSWFIDGRRRWTLTESRVNNTDAWTALASNEKFILLNVAVGGSFPDAIAGFKTPNNATMGGDGASMEVDYVAVYGWL